MTELVHEIALQYQPNAVGAIGHIDVYSQQPQHHPGKGCFHGGFPLPRAETMEAMVAELLDTAPGLCADIGVKFDARLWASSTRQAFDQTLVARVRNAAERLGYSHTDLISGAGHDACWINKVCAHDHGDVPLQGRAEP